MNKTTTVGLWALGVVLMLAPASQAAGGSSSTPMPTITESPEAQAAGNYNRALRYRDKAWKYEEKAEAFEGEETEKLLEKAQKEYKKAIGSLEKAIAGNPSMHQAHSSLGYALRKVGRFDDSISAYDNALRLAPNYTEAIEYRAEAYLGLNRLSDVKSAYMLLLRSDQARADELMTAMRKWVESNSGGTAGVSAEDLDAFSAWVEERATISARAAMLDGEHTKQTASWE